MVYIEWLCKLLAQHNTGTQETLMLFMKSLHNLEVGCSGKFVFRKQYGQTFLQNNKFQTYKINADSKMNADTLFRRVKDKKMEWAVHVSQCYSPYR